MTATVRQTSPEGTLDTLKRTRNTSEKISLDLLNRTVSQSLQQTLDRTLSASFFAGSAVQLEETHTEGTLSSSQAEGGPFAIPSNEEIFGLHDKQRQEQQEAFMTKCMQPVHGKTTFAATVRAAVPLKLAREPTWRNPLRKTQQLREQTAATEATATTTVKLPSSESVSELIAKKREIFLVQMSLDTKKAEIAKLQEHASQREAALEKAEKLLEADVKRFDDFLRQNADKLQEAMSKADTETRAKQEKLAEIKQLNTTIANTWSELARTEEQLIEAKRLQAFLEELTPPEWKEGLVKERDARHAVKVQAWQAECDSIQSKQVEAQVAKAKAEEAYEGARTQQEADRAQADIRAASAALQAARAQQPPPPPELEPLKEDAFYFEEPSQLLEVFSNLEGQNLVLIQSMQEARAALEDACSKQRASKARLDTECTALQAQVYQLESTLQMEMQHFTSLKERALASAEGMASISSEAGAIPMADLKTWVTEAYIQCGFTRDPSMSIVQMMAAIETKLDVCLAAAASLPPGVLEAGEKSREKERRQAAREAKRKHEEEEYRARMDRAVERAAAPTFKKTGKPVMTRSILQKKATIKSDSDAAKESEAELQRYIDQDFP